MRDETRNVGRKLVLIGRKRILITVWIQSRNVEVIVLGPPKQLIFETFVN